MRDIQLQICLFLFSIIFLLQITSKGKIVSFGTQKRIKDLEYEHLSLQITQEMVPSARLIVYYIVGEEPAELVADSVWLNVEQKCGSSLDVSSKIGTEICGFAFILWSDFNLVLHNFFNTSLMCWNVNFWMHWFLNNVFWRLLTFVSCL